MHNVTAYFCDQTHHILILCATKTPVYLHKIKNKIVIELQPWLQCLKGKIYLY